MEAGRDEIYEALCLSEERFRLAFENAPFGMAIVGLDFHIQRVNRAFCDALGYSEQELLSRSFVEITHPEDIERDLALAIQLFRGEIPSYRLEKRFYSKDGQLVWIDLTALVVRGQGGEPLYGLAMVDNITQRKKTEAALRQSEERYRVFFDLTAAGARETDPWDGRLLRVNDAFCRITGYTREELLKLKISDINHPDDREADEQKMKELVRGDVAVYDSEKRFVRPDGKIVWVLANVTLVRNDQGRPLHTIGIIQDITERKRAEEALRRSEERYRSFVANSSEGIRGFESDLPISTTLTVDEQIELGYKYAYLAECNDAVARMYGHTHAEEIIGARLDSLLPAADPTNKAYAIEFINNGYRIQNVESVGVDKDGNKKHFLNNAIGIVENGFLLRAWGTQQDITDRKRAEEQLGESRQQLRALAARLQSLREKERADIAREIHDVLGQGLTGVKIDISWLIKKLPEAGDASVRAKMAERFRDTLELLDETLTSVKTLSAELRPRVLDTFGLSAAVEWQCLEFERRTGIGCECQLPDDDVPLHPERSTALFRIFQETLTNVARHSQATKVHVELTVNDAQVTLIVRDNGRGVTDEEIAAQSSLGFLGMHERAHLLGGDIVIQAHNGRGTVVTARIPIDANIDPDETRETGGMK